MEVWFLAALLFGGLGAVVAQRRSGETFGGFLIGFLFGPFGVIIAALKGPDRAAAARAERAAIRQGLRKCPHCAEFVKQEASVCRFCQRDLPPIAR